MVPHMSGFLQSLQPHKAPRQLPNPSFSSCFLHSPHVTPQSGFSLFSTCVFMTGRLQSVIPLQQNMWHHQYQTRKWFPGVKWWLLCCEKHCRKYGVGRAHTGLQNSKVIMDNYSDLLLILWHVKTDGDRHSLSAQTGLVVQPESGRLEEMNILFL